MDGISGSNPAMSYVNREAYQANLAKDAQVQQGQRALDLLDSAVPPPAKLNSVSPAPSVAYENPAQSVSQQVNATPTVNPTTPTASSGSHMTTDNLGQNVNINV